jgi:hypothetical protein
MWISSSGTNTVIVFLVQATLWCTFNALAFAPMFQQGHVSVMLTTQRQRHHQPQQQPTMLYESTTDDCGCNPASTIIFSGKPSLDARRSNPRQAVKEATSTICDVNGKSVALEDLLTQDNRDVSIVIFLRSLG